MVAGATEVLIVTMDDATSEGVSWVLRTSIDGRRREIGLDDIAQFAESSLCFGHGKFR